MRWKGYLCMAATLGVCLMSAAEASTYNVGVLTANPYTNFVSLPAGTGGFTDVYDFQVTTVSTGGGSVTNIALSFDSTQILNIFDLMMQVFDSNNIPMKEASASLSFPAPIGSYHAEVTGKVTGTSGGAYAVALVAQPVPVPAAVWLYRAAQESIRRVIGA
jgi:hypothetical protein